MSQHKWVLDTERQRGYGEGLNGVTDAFRLLCGPSQVDTAYGEGLNGVTDAFRLLFGPSQVDTAYREGFREGQRRKRLVEEDASDLPEGYMLWMIDGKQELITPAGDLLPIAHDAPFEQIVEEAMAHKALYTVCLWGLDCPVCEERRSRALRTIRRVVA